MHCLYLLVVRLLFSRFANCLATGVLRKHRLQLSRNLRDSPGFLALVPGRGRLYSLSRKFLLQVIRMSNSTSRTIGYC